ncbi:MAG: DEAD/DEAH box helicase [Candidatus Babeliales bacterium]|jgi:ATP-dependent RNA helicase DeaD
MLKKLKFEELGLSKEVLRAIADLGFEEASPIQSEAIPVAMTGRDIIGQAMTGSGKTAAFGIPLIEKVDSKQRIPQALVLCPTRELAIQVAGEINKLSKYRLQIPALPIYGGQPIERQIHALRRGAKIIVATPGRLCDHLERNTISLKAVKMVVLDEADEMLDMGFRDDIEAILKQTPATRQTLLFSATMPAPILHIARTYQKDPHIIRVAHEKVTVPAIEQVYYEIESSRKTDLLTRIIDINNPKRVIVFCNTKRRVDDLAQDLRGRGYSADGIHGDMTQQKRNRVMDRFRKGTTDILIATDVAARGIDVSDIDIVFNYEIPQDEESYVHRIGRTGRAGKAGKAFSLVSGHEMYRFRDVKRYTQANIIKLPVPSFKEIEEVKTNKMLNTVRAAIQEKNLENYAQMVECLLREEFTSLDIAAALLKLYLQKSQPQPKPQQERPEHSSRDGAPRRYRRFNRR